MIEREGIVLASASPRRVELLASAGIEFTVRPGSVVEELQPGEGGVDHARRLAQEKALAVAASPAAAQSDATGRCLRSMTGDLASPLARLIFRV